MHFDEDRTFGDFVKSILRKKAVWIPVFVVFFVLFILLFNPFIIIKAGTRGVQMNWGAVQSKVLNEGFHVIIPIYQTVERMDVRVQKAETDCLASSKDIQDAHARIAVNYHVDPDRAWWVYQNIGIQFKERIIDPMVQEIFKAITARFTAVEMITQREKVRNETKQLLAARLLEYGLIVDDLSIVNFNFSKAYTDAIEAKQTADQLALKAENDLKRIRVEAEQTIAAAKAEAEALRLKNQQVTEQLIRFEAVKKWDGKLPTVTAGAVPFIDLTKMQTKGPVKAE